MDPTPPNRLPLPARLLARIVRTRWWPRIERRLARSDSPEGFDSEEVFWLVERAYRHGILERILTLAPPAALDGASHAAGRSPLARPAVTVDVQRAALLIALRIGERESLWRLVAWLLGRPRVRAHLAVRRAARLARPPVEEA